MKPLPNGMRQVGPTFSTPVESMTARDGLLYVKTADGNVWVIDKEGSATLSAPAPVRPQ